MEMTRQPCLEHVTYFAAAILQRENHLIMREHHGMMAIGRTLWLPTCAIQVFKLKW